MARAKLPAAIPLTFFVLTWVPDAEHYIVHLDDASRSSHNLGEYSPQVVRQLVWWGVTPRLADRAVDAVREFRAVQVIPSKDRVINLFPRGKSKDVVADMLREIESQPANTFSHL